MLTDGQKAELAFWESEIGKYPGQDYGKIVASNLQEKMKYWPEFDDMTGNVLDLGCGPVSIFECRVADCEESEGKDKGRTIYAVDPLLDEYQKIYRPQNPSVLYTTGYRDGGRLPYTNSFFDYIFCINVIDHTEHHALILDEIWRCLKVGGNLLFMVNFDWELTPPNHTMLWDWGVVQKEVSQRLFPERQTVAFNYEHQKYAYWGRFVKTC